MRAARSSRKAVCRCGCGRMTVRNCVLSLHCIFLTSCSLEVNACATTEVQFRILLLEGFACVQRALIAVAHHQMKTRGDERCA